MFLTASMKLKHSGYVGLRSNNIWAGKSLVAACQVKLILYQGLFTIGYTDARTSRPKIKTPLSKLWVSMPRKNYRKKPWRIETHGHLWTVIFHHRQHTEWHILISLLWPPTNTRNNHYVYAVNRSVWHFELCDMLHCHYLKSHPQSVFLMDCLVG